MDDLTLQRLVDRAAIIDVVCAFAVALDTRDWELLRGTLADPVEVDYPDSVGVGTFAAEDLVATAQKFFGRLDATLPEGNSFFVPVTDVFFFVINSDHPKATRYVDL